MLKNGLMAMSLAGALAVIAPGTFQQSQAAQFPHNSGTASTALIDLVRDRLDQGGGGGNRGGAERGSGGDRGMRSGGGETRSFRGDGGGRGDRSMPRESNRSREFRSDNGDRSARHNRGDGDRDRYVRRDRDGDRDRYVQRDRDGDRDGYNRREGRRGDHGDRHRFHRGKRFVWAPGAEFWFYDGYYYGDCDWLRERAVDTGSNYWWTRYQLCREWG